MVHARYSPSNAGDSADAHSQSVSQSVSQTDRQTDRRSEGDFTTCPVLTTLNATIGQITITTSLIYLQSIVLCLLLYVSSELQQKNDDVIIVAMAQQQQQKQRQCSQALLAALFPVVYC